MKIDSREERKSRNGDGDDDGDYDGCGGSGICLFLTCVHECVPAIQSQSSALCLYITN